MRVIIAIAVAAFVPVLAGCASDDAGGASGDFFGADAGAFVCSADADCGDGYVCFDGQCVFQGGAGADEPAPGAPGEGDAPPPPPAPPEMEEVITSRLQPAAAMSGVWVVAPDTDRAVFIAGAGLDVTVFEVGEEPTAVAARGGTDEGVVLCRGSDEVMALTPDGARRTWRLPGHFNALTVSPTGGHAFAWFDLRDVEPGEDASAVQDVTVIDLDNGAVHPVAIGFNPRAVYFAEDRYALFVTDDGVSVIDPESLDGPAVAPTAPVAPDIFSQVEREVVVTADGRFAASRSAGEFGITVVELREAVPRFVALPGEPTDLDLLPDGLTALVMMREARQLALVPLETAVDDPAAIRFVDFEPPLGSASVSPTGDRAMLYATRLDAAPAAAVLSLPEGRIVRVPLRKRARAAAIDPGGRAAWVLHGIEPAEPEVEEIPEDADAGLDDPDVGMDDLDAGLPDEDAGDEDAGDEDAGELDAGEDAEVEDAEPDAEPAFAPVDVQVDPTLAARPGYSLVDLDTGFVKLQITPAEPENLVFTDDGAGFVAFSTPPSVQRLDLVRFDTRDWALGSTPRAIGVLPAVERAFVTQEHPTGRISFVPLDPTDDRVETLTGYALDGRIR